MQRRDGIRGAVLLVVGLGGCGELSDDGTATTGATTRAESVRTRPETSPRPDSSTTTAASPVEVTVESLGGGWAPPYSVRVRPDRVAYAVDCRGGVERTRALSDHEYGETRQRVLDAAPATWDGSYFCHCADDVEEYDLTATVDGTQYTTRFDELAETPNELGQLKTHLLDYADEFDRAGICSVGTATRDDQER